MTNQLDSHAMTLAPGVIETIISITANETDGVASVGSYAASGLRALLAAKPSTSGVSAEFEDDKLMITLHIEAYYGYVLPEVAEKLRQAIYDALLVQVGIEVGRVDIYVDGIQFNQE